jgi:hypothetical protein
MGVRPPQHRIAQRPPGPGLPAAKANITAAVTVVQMIQGTERMGVVGERRWHLLTGNPRFHIPGAR